MQPKSAFESSSKAIVYIGAQKPLVIVIVTTRASSMRAASPPLLALLLIASRLWSFPDIAGEPIWYDATLESKLMPCALFERSPLESVRLRFIIIRSSVTKRWQGSVQFLGCLSKVMTTVVPPARASRVLLQLLNWRWWMVSWLFVSLFESWKLVFRSFLHHSLHWFLH